MAMSLDVKLAKSIPDPAMFWSALGSLPGGMVSMAVWDLLNASSLSLPSGHAYVRRIGMVKHVSSTCTNENMEPKTVDAVWATFELDARGKA